MRPNGSQIEEFEAAGLCTLNLDAGEEVDRDVLFDLFENGLAQDEWLPAGHDYRSRAYQCFAVDPHGPRIDFIPDPPPYVQAKEINSVSGGMRRTFHGLPADHPVTAIVRRLAGVFLGLTLDSGVAAPENGPYLLDAHYIRISAPGKPCPEGIHRDGLVAGSVHLVSLANVRGGETHFTDDDGAPLQSLRLTRFLDSAIFDDKRLLHYAHRPTGRGASRRTPPGLARASGLRWRSGRAISRWPRP
jgi:hypothetical protein